MAYSNKVIDHYENPRNVGSFPKDDADVGTGMVGAPACFTGDTLVSLPSATGTISLRDMWMLNEPMYVWSLNVKTNQFELRLARCVKTGHKHVVQLRIDDGGIIHCTPDHLFLTAEGNYQPAVDLVGKSLKSFNKIIDNNGYWQINRQSREHVALVKALNNIKHSLMWTHNIDHINENKLDNRPENLILLDISTHNQKSKQHHKLETIAQRTAHLCASLSYDEVREMTVVEQLPRWQIGDKLNLTVDWVAEVQRYFGLTAAPKRLLPEEQKPAASSRKLRDGNPNYSGVTDQLMLQVGNALYVLHGKLTNKIWKDHAAAYGMPTKVEHRFGKFSLFVEQAVSFNHKIQTVDNIGTEDVFCLQVEENNNFVVITSSTLNRQTGIVVKNCGDVMKLQIKVNPATGLIEDARFKTYGCGSAIASSSLVTEWVKGKSLDEAATIKNTTIAEELALPPVKIHCSILAEDAIRAAINDYKTKHGAS